MTGRVQRFKIRLFLRSPFLLQGLDAAAFGVDAAQIRDAQGRPLIPGDHLKGLLRQAFEEVASIGGEDVLSAELVDDAFGPRPESASTADEEGPLLIRGSLVLSDLVGPAPDAPERPFEEITRVAIDEETGAAKEAHLLMIERVAPLGATVPFEGELIWLDPPKDAQAMAKCLMAALRLAPAVGAFKSVGFGEIVHERTEISPVDAPASAKRRAGSEPAPERMAYDLTVDRPLLVDSRRAADNLFVGSEIIPGGVVKGALAAAMARRGLNPASGRYEEALSALVFHHAHPVDACGRVSHRALPHSLVTAETGPGDGDSVGDCLLLTEATGVLLGDKAARFSVDWKQDWEKTVRETIGDPVQLDLPKRQRTRTAIDPDKGVSVESQLFSYASVETAGVRWRLVVDAGRCADRHAASELLAILEEGLIGVGKTDACMEVAPVADAPEIAQPKASPVAPDAPDLFAVTLMTPALLTDPTAPSSAAEQYGAFWREALGDEVAVENFMARQTLTGGYLARRYRLYGDRMYAPFHLTMPGSVFLLRCPGEAAQTRLAEALRWCLPVRTPAGVIATWRNCPYTPENGFGAIVCQRVDHAALAGRVAYV